MKPKVKKENWTGSGYCTSGGIACYLQCEGCQFNKKKSEVDIIDEVK